MPKKTRAKLHKWSYGYAGGVPEHPHPCLLQHSATAGKRRARARLCTQCTASPTTQAMAPLRQAGEVGVCHPSLSQQAEWQSILPSEQASAMATRPWHITSPSSHPATPSMHRLTPADGVINMWDGANKKRLFQISRYPTNVASMSFSKDGQLLAVASSYTYEQVREHVHGVGRSPCSRHAWGH